MENHKDNNGEQNNFSELTEMLRHRESININCDPHKPYKWFAGTNLAVIFSLVIITGGAIPFLFVAFLVLIGTAGPWFMLSRSKELMKKNYELKMLTDDESCSHEERNLLKLVHQLALRAGLEVMPEVGLYESENMNAFATGAQRDDSLVAFSSAIVKKMDVKSLSAVAAHEVAHIANGDMITMTVIQSAINAIVLAITFPLHIFQVIAWFRSDLIAQVTKLIKLVLTAILMFFGSLVVKAFSRHREFEADKLASALTDPTSMITALQWLSSEENGLNGVEKEDAVMMISSPVSFHDLISTHPSLERRISSLEPYRQITEAHKTSLSKQENSKVEEE